MHFKEKTHEGWVPRCLLYWLSLTGKSLMGTAESLSMRRDITFLCRLVDFLTINVCRSGEETSNQNININIYTASLFMQFFWLWGFVIWRNISIYGSFYTCIFTYIYYCISIILKNNESKKYISIYLPDYWECTFPVTLAATQIISFPCLFGLSDLSLTSTVPANCHFFILLQTEEMTT